MPVEQFANTAQSTLSAGMLIGDTSLIVTSPASFPSTGQFRVRIGNEIIIVGAVSGSTFSSLTRGAEGTAAATHTIGDAITHVLTAGAIAAVSQQSMVGWVDARQSPYNVTADCVRGLLGTITPGQAVLGDASASWAQTDVGKTIVVANAGAVTQNTTAAITNGTNTVTLAQFGLLAAGDVGKVVEITGAGPAGAVLRSTITSWLSASSFTIAVNASTTVTNATVTYAQALATTIQSVQSATSLTLAASCASGWSGGALVSLQYDYGTDNNAGITSALATGLNVQLPVGRIGRGSARLTVTGQTLRGQGQEATQLIGLVSEGAVQGTIRLTGTNSVLADLKTGSPYLSVQGSEYGVNPLGALYWLCDHVTVDGSNANGFRALSTSTSQCSYGQYRFCKAGNTLSDGFDFVADTGGLDCAYNEGVGLFTWNTGDDGYASNALGTSLGTSHHNYYQGTHAGQRSGGKGSGCNSAGGHDNVFNIVSDNAASSAGRVTAGQATISTAASQLASITSGTATLTFAAPMTVVQTNDVTCTTGQTAITSASGKFSTPQIGCQITIAGATLPAATYIASVQDAYHATLSATCTVGAAAATSTINKIADQTTRPGNPTELQVFGAGVAGGILQAQVVTVNSTTSVTLASNASTTVAGVFAHGGPLLTAGRYGQKGSSRILFNITSTNGSSGLQGSFGSDFIILGYTSQNLISDIEVNLKSSSPLGTFFSTDINLKGDVSSDMVISRVRVNLMGDTTLPNTVATTSKGVALTTPPGVWLTAGSDIHIRGAVKNTMTHAVFADTNAVGGEIEIDLDMVDINSTNTATAAILLNTQSAACVPKITKAAHSNPAGTTGGTKYVVGFVVDAQIAGAVYGDIRSNVASQVLKNTGSGTSVILLSDRFFEGTSSPNGQVTASVGAIYERRDGAAGTTLYVKESGSATNTGWVAYGSPGGQPAPELDCLYGTEPNTTSTSVAWPANFRVIYVRLRGNGTIANVICIPTTLSGSLMVGLYANTGSGFAAKPTGAPILASTSTLMSGLTANVQNPVSLGGSQAVTHLNYWIALAVDNTTATFARFALIQGSQGNGYTWTQTPGSLQMPTVAGAAANTYVPVLYGS